MADDRDIPSATTPAAPSGSAPLAPSPARDEEYLSLPASERRRIGAWLREFDGVDQAAPVTPQLQAIADRLSDTLQRPVSYRTVRRRWSDYTAEGDWRALLDRRRVAEPQRDRTRDRRFVQYFRRLCEANQRSTRAAIRQLRREWKAGHEIPGYPVDMSRARYPRGWSERNLQRLAPSQGDLLLSRKGIRAAKPALPQTFRTRCGLYVGSHIQMDDVWHDHYVRYRDQVARVLEFGALDVYSACRFAWGSKPRLPTKPGARAGLDGGHQGLTEREFRLFLAGVLWGHGYHPERGTVLMLEHGTAAVRGDVEALLADATGGGLRVETGGLSGEQQAVLGLWGGRNAGHGNFKSALESLHNLIHNELAALPGQTGKDRAHLPESTHGLVRYQERLLRWAAEQPPEVQEALRHPLLDYHTQFLPLLQHVYDDLINGRTEHDLEGWEREGLVVTEYRTDPTGDDFFQLDTLPEASRTLITAAARTDPATWSRRRRLSPAEVWERGRGQLRRAHPAIIADIIGQDEARERKVRGSYIRFRDREIDPHDELIYEARLLRPDGREEELADGETIACLANPYAPDQLIALDARGRCLGTARRVHRVRHGDRAAWVEVQARNNERRADRLQDHRERWEDAADDAQDLRRHNAALGYAGGNPRAPRRDDGAREARTVDTARDTEAQAQPVPVRVRPRRDRAQAEPEPESVDLGDDTDCPYF